MKITVTIENDEGDEEEVEFPAIKEVCSDCGGHGTVMNESMRNHAYTPEEFMEEFDEEGRQQYFTRGGIYDVQCPTCKGANVVNVIDRKACERDPELKKKLEQWDEQEEERLQYEAADRATRRGESGYF